MIHQIFINIGKGELKDILEFSWPQSKTKTFCETNNIPYTLWSKEDIEDLLEDYPEYKQLYNDFRYDIQRIDFARLLILYHHGGLYLDLDVTPFKENVKDICNIFNKEFFIARWNTSHLPYNAIISCCKRNPLMLDCIKEVERSFYEKSKMEIYNTWKGRFIFQTTGHYALHRVLKKKIEYTPCVSVCNRIKNIMDIVPDNKAFFIDTSASVWYSDEFKGTI